MTVKIKRLKIWNFKGIILQELTFNTNKTIIYGASETGKSTVIDAYNWLLWGRDRDGKKEQNIKRICTTTHKEISNLNHKVEGEFIVDGETTVLTKSLIERYKGTNNLVGHMIIYHINNKEVTQKEYNKYLKRISTDELYFITTTPSYFCSISTDKQRELLYNISPRADIIIDKRTKLLLRRMKNMSINDYKKEILNQRKIIKEQIASISERINERTYIQNIYSENTQPELVIGTMRDDDEFQFWFSKISNHISDYIKYLSYKSISHISSERLYELIEASNGLNKVLTELDKELDLLKEYATKYHAEVERIINNKFKLAKFDFSSKNNDGETYEIRVNGIQYQSLNRKMKILADLDIISTFSNHYNLKAPIFIDNAESIDNLPKIENQLIILKQSKENTLTIKS